VIDGHLSGCRVGLPRFYEQLVSVGVAVLVGQTERVEVHGRGFAGLFSALGFQPGQSQSCILLQGGVQFFPGVLALPLPPQEACKSQAVRDVVGSEPHGLLKVRERLLGLVAAGLPYRHRKRANGLFAVRV
jgi:hypothetical protein